MSVMLAKEEGGGWYPAYHPGG